MSPNVRRGLEREQTRLRNLVKMFIASGRPEPVGWSPAEYRRRKDYVDARLDDKEQGDINRIMGGPRQTAMMWEVLLTMAEAAGEQVHV